VALLLASNKKLLIGVTEQSVTLLAELGHEDEQVATGTGSELDLVGPDLMGPDLMGPDLMGPDLMGPDLVGTDLAGPGTASSGLTGPTPYGEPGHWQRTSGTPVCLQSADNGGRPDNAWKLAIDLLRERTVRR